MSLHLSAFMRQFSQAVKRFNNSSPIQIGGGVYFIHCPPKLVFLLLECSTNRFHCKLAYAFSSGQLTILTFQQLWLCLQSLKFFFLLRNHILLMARFSQLQFIHKSRHGICETIWIQRFHALSCLSNSKRVIND